MYWNCVELNGVSVLEPKFCLKVSSAWEIFIKRMSGYAVLTTETDSFFLSASLGLQKVTSTVKDMSWR